MIHNISRFIAALALLATAAQGAWAWDGSGTAESPYQIKSTADLDQLATDVNSGTEHEGDYFVLTTDLTYSHTTDWNDANSTENNYTPIGGQYDQQWRYFNGHFDGQGHTISGIRIYKSGGTTAEQCMGLFGRIKGGADVKNVFLADARITANDYSGPIVGYNNGRVENCHVLSDVTVHAVTASADYHGGVVGYNTSSITGCTSAASITAAVSCKYNGGITGSGSGTVEDCIYFGSTVAGDSYVGAIIGYASSGSTICNCYYINDGIASAIGYKKSDSTIDDVRLATSDDFAVSGDTYTIGTAAGWSVMCAALYHNDTYNRFSGKTVQLGADITVTRMAGGDGHAFTGTFDGGGHTLTLDYANTDNNTRTAPFSYVDGATIQNLIVGGTISGTAYRAAGIIGETVNTTSHITNCVSSVDISSGRYTGGFSIGGNVEIEGCVFNGKIKGTTYSGGFIGYSYSAQVIKNSLFAPQDGSSINGGTFYYNGGGDVAPVNSYYTQALGTAQGKACHSVTAGDNVTIGAIALTGTATQYTVSGITAYSGGGLQRGETLYYGSGDQLSLTLTTSAAPLGYQYGYTASAGTLSGQTLTMPDEDVTISAAILSTGLPVTVAYIKADGTPGEASAIALDGTETSLAAGWYFVGKDISYTATLTLGGNVHLILADGKTMNVTTSDYARCIYAPDGQSLHIYGQSEGTGALNAQTLGDAEAVIKFLDGTLAIHGGNVEATLGGTPFSANTIHIARETAGDALVIDRGTLTATANRGTGIYIDGGNVRINGGQVAATGPSSGIDIRDHSTIPGILTLSGGTLTASGFYTFSAWAYAGTLAVASGLTYTDGTSLYDSTTETATLAALGGKTFQPCLALADAADNTAAIADHAGKTLAVALSGRTLYKDGFWNTLCLPFAVDLTASGTLSGDNVQAMTLNTTTSSLADGTLTLNFDAATTIPAGTPFIIKWDESGTDISNPVFEGVTVSNATNDAIVEGVLTFTGTYAPVRIGSDGDNTMLYLGAANKLYYPTKTMTIGTHRAYFQLADGITAGNSAGGNEHGDDVEDLVRAFVLNFGDDEATGIISVHDSGFMVNGSDAWYTLDGRRLDAQPTAKGLYIHGGKKVAIK